jgi:hypothetical protein
MTDLQITTLVPQTSDNERMLLARILSSQQRAAIRGTVLASAARTASTSGSSVDWVRYKGVILFLNITAASGTGGLSIYPEYQDPVSASWNRIYNYPSTASRITTAGLQILHLGPGIGATIGGANQGGFCAAFLSSAIRFTVNHGDASSYTYSLGYELIP